MSPVYYTHLDMYDIIKRAHTATGHGGRDKMLKNLSVKYANITSEVVSCSSHCAYNARKNETVML